MDIESFREYCLSKKGVDEGMPFGEDVLVFKVMGKIFALSGLSEGNRANLKCDPEKAQELREQFSEVQPGYHMNKKHWNTVFFDGTLSEKLLRDLIDHSYELVAASLPKKLQKDLEELN